MKNNKIFILVLIWTLVFKLGAHAQTVIGDVVLPNTYMAGKEKLVINGAGIREKYFMDLYVAGLYLVAKSNDAKQIVSANSSMAIRMVMISSLVTSSRMIESVLAGFNKSTNGHPEKYKIQIEQFKKAFADEIKKNDVFDVVYSMESISIYKNNVLRTEIKGTDFKGAVFGIWLGENPVDTDLKANLLGN